MTSVNIATQRLKFLRAAKRSFADAGWEIDQRHSDAYDFRVDCGNLSFLIKCADERRIIFESKRAVVSRWEQDSVDVRMHGNHQMVVVLEQNFLSIELKNLVAQRIFAVTLDDLMIVSSLAAFGNQVPCMADEMQMYLLSRCIGYAVFVSKLYFKEGDYPNAVKWAQDAVEHGSGYTHAYLWLFNILKAAGDVSAAATIGEKIRQFRPDDPQILRGMEDLARKRGNPSEAAEWHARLIDLPTTPRTFEDILAKQRLQNPIAPAASAAPPPDQPPPERGIARLLKAFRRSSID